jgi:hypothetical protein
MLLIVVPLWTLPNKVVRINERFVFEALLGAFAKLLKETISFVVAISPSIHPSVCMEQLGSHWTGFDEQAGIYTRPNITHTS